MPRERSGTHRLASAREHILDLPVGRDGVLVAAKRGVDVADDLLGERAPLDLSQVGADSDCLAQGRDAPEWVLRALLAGLAVAPVADAVDRCQVEALEELLDRLAGRRVLGNVERLVELLVEHLDAVTGQAARLVGEASAGLDLDLARLVHLAERPVTRPRAEQGARRQRGLHTLGFGQSAVGRCRSRQFMEAVFQVPSLLVAARLVAQRPEGHRAAKEKP